ncbi:MAG: HlyD family secretion protein [Lentisphaeria bacterium]|nr:HlyD family secretion protein [Lentisphaeria bacterium]
MSNQVEKFNFRRLLKTFHRIGVAIILMLAVLLGLVIFGKMDDEVSGKGVVTGIREYNLKSLVDAPSVRIIHHEGESVAAGEPVMELDSRPQREKITLLRHQLQELENAVSAKEKALALLRRDPLPEYYRNTELELAAAEEKLKLAEKEFEVYSDLYAKKTVTRKEFLQVELNLLSTRMTVQRLERDRKRLDDGMARQIVERAANELAQLRHRLSAKRDELGMEIRRLEDYIIRAPDSGIITDIPPRPGNYYAKGDAVAKFAADKYKKVIGLIHESQIYKVRRGQTVRIEAGQYNYLDYGYFYGKVDAVYQLPESIDGANYYPVKILLFGEQMPLRFGSSCRVTIITGRERILALLLGIRSQDYLVRRGLRAPTSR